jgi:hypothetical protein
LQNVGGPVLLTIRYRNKFIKFEKGNSAIGLPSKAELETSLQNIKKSADNKEFDKLVGIFGGKLLLFTNLAK